MKFCAIVAEYNPFHLGHLKQIEYVKNVLGAENIIVIMSGNFTQRGEASVLDKFTRSKHAIIAGADLVIELPTVFAISNAEKFAKGAIKIATSLNLIDGICFGVESGKVEDYIELATALNDESKEFKSALKEQLSTGISFAKAKYNAVKSLGKDYDENLLSLPNNILGVEYTRALLNSKSTIQIHPMLRDKNHNDVTLKKGITSATSIRTVLKQGKFKKLKKSLPDFVYKDLKSYPYDFDKIIVASLLTSDTDKLKQTPDCTEGLENRLKALSKDNKSVEELIERAYTKRYTKARIRRILTANLLGVTEKLVNDCLCSDLYAKVLAVNEDKKDLISILSQTSSIPLLTRKSDLSSLKKTALTCFEIDYLASELYGLATDEKFNENYTLFI